MSLSVALQMDPVDSIDIQGDSSFALGLEAQRLGHQLYFYHPNDISYDHGEIVAWVQPLTLRRKQGDHFSLEEPERRNLREMEVILMRQDPPFDMQYIGITHLLEQIHPETLVVNHPVEVRNAPEKLLVTHFKQFMPPTLITRSVQEVYAFREAHKDIIVKPLFGNGGAGVFHLKPDDENLSSLLETFFGTSREQLMVQRYVPEIRQGDKRIILVNGEPIGGINRVPAAGEARANMHVGGQAKPTDLTPREQKICAAMGPMLKQKGLIFVGIDVIGDYLTEINVTSPTGLQELGRFQGTTGTDQAPEALIWQAIHQTLDANKA